MKNQINAKTLKEVMASKKRHDARGYEMYPYYVPEPQHVESDLAACFLLAVIQDNDLSGNRFSVCRLPKRYDETYLPNGKPWWRDLNGPFYYWTYEDNDMRLTFYTVNERRVCLEHIEMFEPGKGQGTKMMDSILDLADKFGVEIELVPVAVNNNGTLDDIKRTCNRLRSFYMDFEFKTTFNSALLIYKPQPQA